MDSSGVDPSLDSSFFCRLDRRYTSNFSWKISSDPRNDLRRSFPQYSAPGSAISLVFRFPRNHPGAWNMVQAGSQSLASATDLRSVMSRPFHGGTRGRTGALGHQFSRTGAAGRGFSVGAESAAGVSADPLAGRLSDHCTDAHLGVFEHDQKLGSRLDDRVSGIVTAEPATRRVHSSLV